MGYTYIDNILGQPIPEYVMNQLNIRSKKSIGMDNDGNPTTIRDSNSLVYVANKTGWVRVISSVDIKSLDAASSIQSNVYNDSNGTSVKEGSQLAKSFVLFGGTSAYNDTTKTYEPKLYREGYTQDYGFRPIAGITSAKINTQGKLGSILQAEIDFKANTKQQLDIIDILYFKLGYTMIVEWGNTFYFKQKNDASLGELATEGSLHKSEDSAITPFDDNTDVEQMRIKIAKAIRETDGNYDAMVGIVTNFSYVSNTDGGFDCKIRILGPGMLAESMRTNTIQSIPQVYKDAIKKLANYVNTIKKNKAIQERNRILALSNNGGGPAAKVDKSDANIPDNYPECVKSLINAKKLVLADSTNTGLIAAEAPANQTASGFKGYRFFINNRYQDSKTVGLNNYECDKYNRVVDTTNPNPSLRGILGDPGEQPLTEQELIEKIKNKTLATKYPNVRTLTGEYSAYSGKTDYQDLSFSDNSKKNQYHFFEKLGKLVSAPNINDIPSNNVKAQILVTNQFLGITTYDLKTVLTFFAISKTNPLAKNKNIRDTLMGPFGSVNLGDSSFEYDDFDTQPAVTGKEYTVFDIDYTRAAEKNSANTLRSSWKITFQHRTETTDNKSILDDVEFNRQAIGDKMYELVSNPDTLYTVKSIYGTGEKGATNALIPTILEIEMPVTLKMKYINTATGVPGIQPEDKTVLFQIILSDHSVITTINQATPPPDIAQPVPAATAAAPAAALPPLEYTKIDPAQLQDTESARYKSQLEGMLRTVQLSTISEFINVNSGEIKDVNKINWTSSKKYSQLTEIFSDGAFGSGILNRLINNRSDILSDENLKQYYNKLLRKERFEINALFGFPRNLMKDNVKDINDPKSVLKQIKDDQQYKVDFNEMLTSYVIPYYQTKDLIDGGDIHYPTYITMGFFFMMLNHCGFLYDTTEPGLNIPITYLDFNQGTNLMLSSDFMMSANPYRFVVKFTGDINSYRKLFDESLLDGNSIKSSKGGSKATPLWSGDGVSKHLPKFKLDSSNSNDGIVAYRGRLMDVVVSIDYLLDLINKHATRDETNAVYFRSLMDEILGDLGKALGNYNYFRLAYDDYSNTFYVTDDQNIPSNTSLYNEEDKYDLPVYGKKSIAKSFSIQTENSSKLGNVLAISGNSDVKNQTTVGIDGTSYGNANLYAVDRYKKALTGANDNVNNKANVTKELAERRAQAATRFNDSVKAYFAGKSRSEEGVEQSTNYYIEAVAKARNKGEDNEINATLLLPLSANFSTDGVSGLGIYHSFTLPDQVLPYSYLLAAGGFAQNATKRVGFIITGLEHNIQNNVWTTDVKANMYYVKNKKSYNLKKGKQTDVVFNTVSGPPSSKGSQTSVASSGVPATINKNKLSTFGKVDADVDVSIKPFLDLIAYAEGTAALGSNDGYDVIIGGTILPDWNENYDKPHPKVGLYIPRLYSSSDAFGRYQYLSRYWLSKTFDNQFVNKKNQDLTAQETILATYRKSAAQSCLSIAKSAIAGGNTDVNANSDFLTALDKLAPIWASLKTSQGASIYAGQVSPYSVQDLYNIYLEAVKLY